MVNPLKRARSLFLDSLTRYQAGDLPAAEAQLRESITLDERRPSALGQLALVLLRQDRHAEAADWARRALALEEQLPGIWLTLAECHLRSGAWQEALTGFQRAATLDPGLAGAWSGMGQVQLALGHPEAAIPCLERAVQLAPGDARAWLHRGVALQRQWRLVPALQCVEQALAIDPRLVDAWERKGSLLLLLKRESDSLAALDQALALDRRCAQAWFSRGNTLQALDRDEEALAAYDRAIELDPRLDDAWSARASLHVSDVLHVERAVQESRTSLEAYLAGIMQAIRARPEGKTLQRFRLQHDLQQARHLQARGIALPGSAAFIATAGQLLAASAPEATQLAPALADWEAMLPYLSAPYYHPAPELPGRCLNLANDWAGIERAYLEGRPQLVAIDNFLAPEALAAFREFALCSRIWLTEYVGRYLGAFANRGFATPLHLQLARELAQAMPQVFRNYRLTQLWGFKYDALMPRGINVHADFARVNLNFWLTPDEFNLDPESGGLKVYDVPSPPDWPPYDYNENEAKIYAFLKEKGAGAVRVPHRCNRAVLFNSALFHETDEIHFQPGYESRRLNFTYLFGRQL